MAAWHNVCSGFIAEVLTGTLSSQWDPSTELEPTPKAIDTEKHLDKHRTPRTSPIEGGEIMGEWLFE